MTKASRLAIIEEQFSKVIEMHNKAPSDKKLKSLDNIIWLIARVKRLEDVLDKLGKAVVMGKREDIIYACQKAKEALSEGDEGE